MDPAAAQLFIISRVIGEAEVAPVKLSEVEKNAPQFSEVDRSLPDIFGWDRDRAVAGSDSCLEGEPLTPLPWLPVRDSDAGAWFAIRVHPRAKKNAIPGEVGDRLKLALTRPPAEGKANDAGIEFFANLLKVPRWSVTIAAGQSGRNKVIRVAGLSAKELAKRRKLRSNP
jgi:uncharacterized protein (TIGR00251 family)